MSAPEAHSETTFNPKDNSNNPSEALKDPTFSHPPTHHVQTSLTHKVHPRAEKVCAEVNAWFLRYWPFKDDKQRTDFLLQNMCLWSCMAYPLARDELIVETCKVRTFMVFTDDALESMSHADGEKYVEKLIGLASGKLEPDKNEPLDCAIYDIWRSKPAQDEHVGSALLDAVTKCWRAQLLPRRLNITDFGEMLKIRRVEAGWEMMVALMRFGMGLHLSPTEIASVSEIDDIFCKAATTVNDIYSLDCEINQWHKLGYPEGATVINAVQLFSDSTKLPLNTAKKVLWGLVREWEKQGKALVEGRIAAGCSEEVKRMLLGLECIGAGNEVWSREGQRYKMHLDP